MGRNAEHNLFAKASDKMSDSDRKEEADDVQHRLDAIRRLHVADSSRAVYKRKALKIIQYFKGLDDTELVQDGRVQLNLVTIDHIESFFIDLYTSDEQRPSISTLNGYSSALRFMFTEQNISLPASF